MVGIRVDMRMGEEGMNRWNRGWVRRWVEEGMDGK